MRLGAPLSWRTPRRGPGCSGTWARGAGGRAPSDKTPTQDAREGAGEPWSGAGAVNRPSVPGTPAPRLAPALGAEDAVEGGGRPPTTQARRLGGEGTPRRPRPWEAGPRAPRSRRDRAAPWRRQGGPALPRARAPRRSRAPEPAARQPGQGGRGTDAGRAGSHLLGPLGARGARAPSPAVRPSSAAGGSLLETLAGGGMVSVVGFGPAPSTSPGVCATPEGQVRPDP